MNKVILTQRQAGAIEQLLKEHERNKDEIIDIHCNEDFEWGERYASVEELKPSQLARALYIGYEVEPEFKVGDWVVTKSGYIGEIEFINKVEGWVNIGDINDTKERGVCLAKTFNLNEIERHLTPSEIAEEKERRWWKKHGRDVWELRARDILKQKSGNELAEVKKVHNSGYLIGKWTCYESKEYIKKHYTVACFAENRLDVKDDE